MRCVCLVTTVITDQTQPPPFKKFKKNTKWKTYIHYICDQTIILLNLSKLNQFGSIWGWGPMLRRHNLAAKKKLFEFNDFFWNFGMINDYYVMWRTGGLGWYRVDIGLRRGHLGRNDDKFTHFLPNYLLLGTFSPSGPISPASQLFLTTLLLRAVFEIKFFWGRKEHKSFAILQGKMIKMMFSWATGAEMVIR